MKINAVFSSNYLPTIYYYNQFIKNSEVVIDVNEYFVKQTYRNRCTILGANGVQDLIVPIKNRNSKMAMKEVEISNAENWQIKHWRTIESAYRKSPFFEYYADELINFYTSHKFENLVEFNSLVFLKVNELLKLDVGIHVSEKYIESYEVETDYRNVISKKNRTIFLTKLQYIQVFSDKLGFQSNLSILDLLFNEGPNSLNYFKNVIL